MRSQEVALLAKHAFAVAQAFHSYYQKPAYSVLYAQSDDLRAFRTLVVDAFLREMECSCHLWHPHPGPDVMRPRRGHHRQRPPTGGPFLLLRQDYVRAIEPAGGLPVVLAPGRPEDAPELLARVQGLVLSGGGDVDPSHYGEAPHPTVGRSSGTGPLRAGPLPGGPPGTCPPSLSVGANRC